MLDYLVIEVKKGARMLEYLVIGLKKGAEFWCI